MPEYTISPFIYQRRKTCELIVGNPKDGGVIIGGDNPIVVQSMLTADTMDTDLCVKQTLDLVKAGCQIVRITAPTVKDAANLKNIVEKLRLLGCKVPIVADIHFKPEAAMEAVKWVDIIRINPGNYADSKKFAVKSYTDEQYRAELEKIESKFSPLVHTCIELNRAMRIGVNHGSLSDRIMNRYGDTPQGMIESAIEFATIARKYNYHNFKFSMKSSNPKIMIQCYRLLVSRLNALGEDWNYPLHLGVTEAGEGEDGRIKSAIGIGSLLCDGIGDTIRVSLTEDSVYEIPVCYELIKLIPYLTIQRHQVSSDLLEILSDFSFPFNPYNYQRRLSAKVCSSLGIPVGEDELIRVFVTNEQYEKLPSNYKISSDVKAEGVYEKSDVFELNPLTDFAKPPENKMVAVSDDTLLPVIAAYRLLASRLNKIGARNPILLKDTFNPQKTQNEIKDALLFSSTNIGSLLCDGIGDAILIRAESDAEKAIKLAYNILQSSGSRSFKTEYVACPSCGRTLFNLQEVTAKIKSRTGHLKGVKIAIMGCIVNGPGEMADADFGYVGGAPGKINLYVGKKPVRFNIPQEEAVDCLVDLIKEYGKWSEPLKQ
ncbi:MAG TPA: (E)-4-hydroxy-3-methylbut-2-enyl-diphosphate synthase [Verrucomicrobiota bacterium]|nr:(E)-4-hydroxy-3-methylbut-2-enyl-diphosphate synthase [Verrucomicrobiota bacterium]